MKNNDWFQLRPTKRTWWWVLWHPFLHWKTKLLIRDIEVKVKQEIADFPETVTWDHLPKPTWRDLKLREDRDR